MCQSRTSTRRRFRGQSGLEVLEVGEGLTFAQGVRTVLRGVRRLAAALGAAAAAEGHRGPSHLDGFVSNDRRELFTLQRTERDKQASGVQASASVLPVTAAISATAAAAIATASIPVSIIISCGRISMARTLISTLWKQQCLTRFSFFVLNEHKFDDIMLIKCYYSTRINSSCLFLPSLTLISEGKQ